MSAEYETYPLTLAHPQFSASKPIPVPGSEIYGANGEVVRRDYRGTPERLPPVTVRNESEEEYYRAQGYERAGKMDPSAWVRAHADAPSVDYVPQAYPKWVDGVLILSAQEDPNASETDLAPPAPKAEAEPEPAAPSEAANLRAQMDEMNRTMAAMIERTQAAEAESARLKVEAETRATADAIHAGPASGAIRRPPGRPRKDA